MELISRQQAIDAIEAEKIKRGDYLTSSYVGYEMAEKVVKQLPSIQQKGRWIKLDMHRGMADHKCTACKQECYVPTCMGEPMYAFCPNCGADMRERKERTVRAIDADALQRAIVEEGQANKRKKYVIGDIWELTGAEIRDVINSQPTIQPEPHWIPVTERLPEEEDSIFARYYGTDRWRKSMFRKKSREVIVTSVFEDGELHTEVAHTTDGEWHVGVNVVPRTVIAWMPLPEPYKGVTE